MKCGGKKQQDKGVTDVEEDQPDQDDARQVSGGKEKKPPAALTRGGEEIKRNRDSQFEKERREGWVSSLGRGGNTHRGRGC